MGYLRYSKAAFYRRHQLILWTSTQINIPIYNQNHDNPITNQIEKSKIDFDNNYRQFHEINFPKFPQCHPIKTIDNKIDNN